MCDRTAQSQPHATRSPLCPLRLPAAHPILAQGRLVPMSKLASLLGPPGAREPPAAYTAACKALEASAPPPEPALAGEIPGVLIMERSVPPFDASPRPTPPASVSEPTAPPSAGGLPTLPPTEHVEEGWAPAQAASAGGGCAPSQAAAAGEGGHAPAREGAQAPAGGSTDEQAHEAAVEDRGDSSDEHGGEESDTGSEVELCHWAQCDKCAHTIHA